jgi:hypothetical protein
MAYSRAKFVWNLVRKFEISARYVIIVISSKIKKIKKKTCWCIRNIATDGICVSVKTPDQFKTTRFCRLGYISNRTTSFTSFVRRTLFYWILGNYCFDYRKINGKVKSHSVSCLHSYFNRQKQEAGTTALERKCLSCVSTSAAETVWVQTLQKTYSDVTNRHTHTHVFAGGDMLTL